MAAVDALIEVNSNTYDEGENLVSFISMKTLSEIQSALAKQIPQKPYCQSDGYDGRGNKVYDTWLCPHCRAMYEVDYDDFDFCPKCGQAIKWDEETWPGM